MSRIKPEQEIKYICSVIDKNIEAHKILKDRGLLSENILAQLRNLTEDVAILINNIENSLSLDIHYNNVDSSIKYVSSVKKYKYISIFHKFLQSPHHIILQVKMMQRDWYYIILDIFA